MTSSKIEWTDRSDWNPIRGCSRVSNGCGGPGDNGGCYAEAMAARFSKPGMWGHGFAEMKSGKPRWTGKVELQEDRLTLPLTWKKPKKIFVSSTSDVFHEKLPDEAIDRIFAVMALCPQHTFQILTKRPERMREYFNGPFPNGNGVMARIAAATCEIVPPNGHGTTPLPDFIAERPIGPSIGGRDNTPEFGWRRFFKLGPIPNVWLGTSCEDQPTADTRIPHLLATPAAIRFLSCEPLLGKIDLRNLKIPRRWGTGLLDAFTLDFKTHHGEIIAGPPSGHGPIDWIICGGESGPHARPMHPDWARSLRDQCAAADVPFFFKQWGDPGPADDAPEWTRNLPRHSNKLAGRKLDGVEHNHMPNLQL